MNDEVRENNRRTFFNERAEGWNQMWYFEKDTFSPRYNREFDRLFAYLSLQPGDRVLDLGCGAGILVPRILAAIGKTGSLLEVDYAEQMIEVNRKLHDDPRIEFLAENVTDLKLAPASFDAIVCFSCFPHFQDKQKSLNVMANALKSGRKIFIAHFNSAEEINAHHGKHESVRHDHLPEEMDMRKLIRGAGLETELFINEPGFYLAVSLKPNLEG